MYTDRIFMKCTHVNAAKKAYLTLFQIKPDFPSSADEIAEPRPDMNIKVTAFTVSEKTSNLRIIPRLDPQETLSLDLTISL